MRLQNFATVPVTGSFAPALASCVLPVVEIHPREGPVTWPELEREPRLLWLAGSFPSQAPKVRRVPFRVFVRDLQPQAGADTGPGS